MIFGAIIPVCRIHCSLLWYRLLMRLLLLVSTCAFFVRHFHFFSLLLAHSTHSPSIPLRCKFIFIFCAFLSAHTMPTTNIETEYKSIQLQNDIFFSFFECNKKKHRIKNIWLFGGCFFPLLPLNWSQSIHRIDLLNVEQFREKITFIQISPVPWQI